MKAFVLSTKHGHIFAHYPLSLSFDPSLIIKKALVEKKSGLLKKYFIKNDHKTFLLHRRRIPAAFFWHITECDLAQSFFLQKEKAQNYPWPVCITCRGGLVLWVNDEMLHFLGLSLSQVWHKPISDFIASVDHPSSEKVYARLNEKKSGPFIYIKKFEKASESFVFYFAFINKKRTNDLDFIDCFSIPCGVIDQGGNFVKTNNSLSQYIDTGLHSNLEQWAGSTAKEKILSDCHSLKQPSCDKDFVSTPFMVNGKGRFLALISRYSDTETTEGDFLCFFSCQSEDGAHSEKMQLVGQLASGIVHDFNNLLTGILGFCDLLLKRHEPEEMSFQDIQQIKQSALRASSLIQKLLNFSKSHPLPSSSFSLKECLVNLMPLIKRVVGPKIVPSIQCIENDSFFVHADFVQVEQSILNLSINARDAMEKGGDLSFSIQNKNIVERQNVAKGSIAPNKYVVLSIRDTGMGIDAQNIDRIFDSFFSTKGPGQGTGLGLSTVLESMHQFQGGISVESKKGEGTTFSLFFPQGSLCMSQGVSKKSATILDDAHHQNITIVLVEDEDAVRLFAARALREHGHTVIEMRDGIQALDYLNKNTDIHMLITDVMMPGMDGPCLAEHFYKKIPDLLTLFVSGYPEAEVRRNVPAHFNNVSFLSKPFTLNSVVNKVHAIIKRHLS